MIYGVGVPVREIQQLAHTTGPDERPVVVRGPTAVPALQLSCAEPFHLRYHRRINLRFFFGRVKIGGGDLELVLRNEGKIWYKIPCCCFLVDGCYFFVASG